MTAAYPGSFNTFVPSFDATGQLTVMYSRNPKDFSINKYITLTPVKKSLGYYLRVTAEVAARVINSDLLREFIWNDGDDAPSGDWNTEAFEFQPFATQRYVFPFRLGYKANEQADWKMLAAHAAFEAQNAMTARTIRVVTAVTTGANYDTGHSDTATNWGGGALNTGTPTSPVLKKALNAMSRQIHKATLGAVKPKDLKVVFNPVTADAISRSQEVHAYLKESQFALAQVRGDKEGQNALWGLPDTIYGYPIVVEDAVRVTSKKGATRAVGYAWADGTTAMVARPGALTSDAGGPSWSTCHLFSYEEMTTEQRDDPDNRRIKGRVVEDYDVRIVAPSSGALCTGALG